MEILQRFFTHDDCEIRLVESSTRNIWKWGGYVRLRIIKVSRDFEKTSHDLMILNNGVEVKGCDKRPDREYARALERLLQEMRTMDEIDDLYIEITSAEKTSPPISFQRKRI